MKPDYSNRACSSNTNTTNNGPVVVPSKLSLVMATKAAAAAVGSINNPTIDQDSSLIITKEHFKEVVKKTNARICEFEAQLLELESKNTDIESQIR
eukprot:15367179-Ditylum_brightwellii.AAC.1